MTTAQHQIPDYTVDDAATYKAKIDGNAAVVARIGAAYQAYAASTPNMTVKVAAGALLVAGAVVENAIQTTGTITAPVSNSRIDRVVIDATTGAVSVITGTSGVSPTAPALTTGKLPVAQVLLTSASTAITNSMITDERVAQAPAASGGGFYVPGASVGSSALTVTLPAGTVCNFNDGTSVTLASTLSLTVSSGSTLGTVSGTPSCIWVAVVKNSGTPELAVRNNVSYAAADALSIAGFSMSESISTTAEGGAGGADSAQTWYSTTSRSSQPWAPVGFVLSTQTTAGTWAQTVTAVGFGPGSALPGAVIGFTRKESGALVSGSTSIPFDDTIPQNTEGVLTLTATHTRRMAASVMEVQANVQAVESANTADLLVVAMFQDSTANALKAASSSMSSAESAPISTPISHVMVSGATGNTDIKIRCGLNAATQVDVNGIGGVRRMGGVYDTSITIKEYQP